jgi:hypothetical protein
MRVPIVMKMMRTRIALPTAIKIHAQIGKRRRDDRLLGQLRNLELVISELPRKSQHRSLNSICTPEPGKVNSQANRK